MVRRIEMLSTHTLREDKCQRRRVCQSGVSRRDKSLSALCNELIARYGQDGTIIDLDEVQVFGMNVACASLHSAAVPCDCRLPFPTGRSGGSTT